MNAELLSNALENKYDALLLFLVVAGLLCSPLLKGDWDLLKDSLLHGFN